MKFAEHRVILIANCAIVLVALAHGVTLFYEGSGFQTTVALTTLAIMSINAFCYFQWKWRLNPLVIVIVLSLVVPFYFTEIYFLTAFPAGMLIAPSLALILVQPKWVLISGTIQLGFVLMYLGPQPGINLATTSTYYLILLGLIIARSIADSSRIKAEENEAIANQRASELEQKTLQIEFQAKLLNQVGQAVVAGNINRELTYWNKAAGQLFGLTEEHLNREYSIFKLLSPDAENGIDEILNGFVKGRPWFSEYEVTGTREETKTVYCTSVPIVPDFGQVTEWVSVITDITEIRKAKEALVSANKKLTLEIEQREQVEEQFRHAQKMEAIGLLAGGIAHDFNNLLVPIIGYSEIAMMECSENSPLSKHLQQVLNAAEQGAKLTKQILAFSRKQFLEMQVLDVNQVITDFKITLHRLIREDIEFKTILHQGKCNILADLSQLNQILMNLAINATDAMPEGGRLSISTEIITLDSARVEGDNEDQEPGETVRIAVSDSGVGIAEHSMAHIFEPFFTTKPMGQGTGLGLSTVFGIVKQHKGDISVDSKPGQGTSFTIDFPKTTEPEKICQDRPISKQQLNGDEHILVVEDEESVRQLVCEMLVSQGYKVTEAVGPKQALDQLRPDDDIQLLITDFVMPGMNGRELHGEIIKVLPKIKAIYISGYTNDTLFDSGLKSENINYVAKPFSISTLLHKVRTVVDSGKAYLE